MIENLKKGKNHIKTQKNKSTVAIISPQRQDERLAGHGVSMAAGPPTPLNLILARRQLTAVSYCQLIPLHHAYLLLTDATWHEKKKLGGYKERRVSSLAISVG